MIVIIILQVLYRWRPTCAIISKVLATTYPLMLWNHKCVMRILLLYSFYCVEQGLKNQCSLWRFCNFREAWYLLCYAKFNLENLFWKGKSEVYVIFSNEFMTKSILDSIGMNETHIFMIIFIYRKIWKKHFYVNVNFLN